MAAHLKLASGRSHQAPSEAAPIKVMLADDHAAVRRSMRWLLDAEEDMKVVAEAADLGSVLRDLDAHGSLVLVLDLQTRDGSSLDAIRGLRTTAPDTQIVALTMEDSPLFAQRALDAGAIAFVLKHRADTDLARAVRSAARGEEYVSPHVAKRLESLRRAMGDDGLSTRETEVLRAIALGYTSAEIARQLHVSRGTVDAHRVRIQRKLGLSSRAELVRYALSHHLIGKDTVPAGLS